MVVSKVHIQAYEYNYFLRLVFIACSTETEPGV